ncbi:N-acetylmuramic acid 6-phosphate etherase [Paenibacillus sp. JCM 10914]|uniref:N-acetylmuramic acid 6-phosphate etherase n=1 Tax=Paenibacillus sp. JCM 10914 TaxID=1236974 RepID=UPI0003CC7453|nr:N-acetylmuramic acid 6-phosphate etherase [Paenibacillus sp. JCM 10914]GAE09035.1 N-acetylmuramic acid 6-phosphate etherase [Paenibacillus sp. JCM 10914]
MTNILSQLTTEQPHDNTQNIDQLNSEQIMTLINSEDHLIADAIRELIPVIARAADHVVEAFQKGGRLFYIGAGTSGRIGILDASECPPTYGTDPSMVQGLIAGGFKAVKEAIEGAEDSEELGEQDIISHGITDQDVVIGIAASGRTPYVLGAMRRAKAQGAIVIGLCNNYESPMHEYALFVIEAVVGPEVIMGSTRMKAGTSQKLILNMLTTTAMIRIGKVYKNLMVDLNPSNNKLVYRAKRIIKLATGADDDAIEEAYHESGAHVKTAIVMLLASVSAEEAAALLQGTSGFVRSAIDLKTPQ